MNKVTIILGPQESGKTTKARELIGERKYTALSKSDLKSPFSWPGVYKDTEVILIDEFEKCERIKNLITSETITVHKQAEWPFEMTRPEVILVSGLYQEADFIKRRWIEIITLPTLKNN